MLFFPNLVYIVCTLCLELPQKSELNLALVKFYPTKIEDGIEKEILCYAKFNIRPSAVV
jgi:hypothetical protein